MPTTPPVHVVVPGDIDDPELPSGGNVYDRRICLGLPAAGRPVRRIPVDGAWPRPDTAARTELGDRLAALPDGAVVLLDGLVACGVPDVITPHAERLRLVVLVHLPLADERGLAPALAAELAAAEKATLTSAAAIVTTSPWAARRLAEVHDIPADRVHVVTPGADPAPLASAAGSTRLLCVGSVTPTKGQDLLVEALAAVADLEWSCLLVGPLRRDPAHVETVQRLIDAHGLGERVLLAGPLVGERLASTFAAADLLVVPSRAESYGMVVIEALARGLPVLAADVDGVPDALGHTPDGQVPGIVVRPSDVTALAEGLRRWLTQRDLRRSLRNAARARRATVTGWEVTSRCLARVLTP
nr:glycosyltransferase family 4 protein [Pseudonocardia sp. TRM90224]